MIKLELTDQMVAVIGEALGNAPFKIAAPVVGEIQKQISAQNGKQPPEEQNEMPVTFATSPIVTVFGGGDVLVSINLSGSTVFAELANAGTVVGAVTVTTSPPGGQRVVTIVGADAALFALTNGGLTPCNLVVGGSNIGAGFYDATLSAT